MKTINKIITAALLITALFAGCKDDMAEVNTDPSVISKPDIRFLFTQALKDFKPTDYRQWFYDYTYMFRWGQITIPGGGNSDQLNVHGVADGLGGTVYRTMGSVKEIHHIVNNELEGEEQASYQYIKSMTYPLLAHLAILDSDMYGSMAYSEAFQARYTNPALLTPKYDTQEELYTILLSELDNTIQVLSNPVEYEGKTIDQVSLGKQDFIYNGDVKKWLKLTNSLKLKIAVRLLHADKAKALKIAEEVASSPAGILETLDDGFYYNVGTKDYHFNDEPYPGYLSKPLGDFLVNNKDPRVRFYFQKNDFNSKVVQAYFDAKAENPKSPDLPFYIEEKVNFSTDKDGNKKFEGWKEPGEPWVRYFGGPVEILANTNPEYNDYFDPQNNRFKITLNGQERSYRPISIFNREMLKGNFTYDFPDAPGAAVVQDKEPQPWFGLFLSAAEVNFYLAELKLIGANLPESAQSYFSKAVELSVKEIDKLAELNQIPYYSNAYDKEFGKPIKLMDGEIEELLKQPAYKLSGDKNDDLEKVYIQQHIHFVYQPADMFAAMRRSGVPKYDSKFLKLEKFSTSEYPLPRRFGVKEPLKSDKMYEIILNAYKAQGYTMNSVEPSVLNTERVWNDKGAPQFGEGPNF